MDDGYLFRQCHPAERIFNTLVDGCLRSEIYLGVGGENEQE